MFKFRDVHSLLEFLLVCQDTFMEAWRGRLVKGKQRGFCHVVLFHIMWSIEYLHLNVPEMLVKNRVLGPTLQGVSWTLWKNLRICVLKSWSLLTTGIEQLLEKFTRRLSGIAITWNSLFLSILPHRKIYHLFV